MRAKTSRRDLDIVCYTKNTNHVCRLKLQFKLQLTRSHVRHAFISQKPKPSSTVTTTRASDATTRITSYRAHLSQSPRPALRPALDEI